MLSSLAWSFGKAKEPVAAVAEEVMAYEKVLYKEAGSELEGLLYLPENFSPENQYAAFLVVHQWMGIGPHEMTVAERQQNDGHVVFVADIYGKGVRPDTMTAAGAQSKKFKSDRDLLRARVNAALEQLKSYDYVNTEKIVAMGYCFGGTTVLELARSGADLAAVASFHGNLDTPDNSLAENIQSEVWVFHGAADPYVPKESVEAFETEMTNAGIDYKFMAYEGAVHSFTDRQAIGRSGGASYQEAADRQSWRDFSKLVKETIEVDLRPEITQY